MLWLQYLEFLEFYIQILHHMLQNMEIMEWQERTDESIETESYDPEESLTNRVNSLYNLWKNGKYVTEQGYTKNRYADIPYQVERKYGKQIRELSKNMKVDSSEQSGLLKSSVLLWPNSSAASINASKISNFIL